MHRGKKRGVVTKVADIHTDFFCDHSNDATVLPYFEGDYWVSDVEVIIEDLKKSYDRRKPFASSFFSVGTAPARDPVMAKLSKIIAPMKSSFIVVKLQPENHLSTRLDFLKGCLLFIYSDFVSEFTKINVYAKG